MKRVAKKISKARAAYNRAGVKLSFFYERHQLAVLLLLTSPLLLNSVLNGGLAHARSGQFNQACNIIVGQMLETSFGALVAAAAGLGAIIAAAVGGFKAAWALLVVSVACFILRALLTLTWDQGNCQG